MLYNLLLSVGKRGSILVKITLPVGKLTSHSHMNFANGAVATCFS